MHAARMLSRVRNHFRGAKFARMSSGTYCVIRDLGLVKGGKGMRHHEVLVTFSFRALWRSMGRIGGYLVSVGKRRVLWLRREVEPFGGSVSSSVVPEVPSGHGVDRLPVRIAVQPSHSRIEIPSSASSKPMARRAM
jgi:hypothetical protein